MYKKFSISDAKTTKTSFVENVQKIMRQERLTSAKQLIQWWENYEKEKIWYEWSQASFRIIKWEKIILIDEKEKIELILDESDISSLHNLVNKWLEKWAKSILESLLDDFSAWNIPNIQEKDFLVYDIETLNNFAWMKNITFEIWYSIQSNDKIYKLTEKDKLKKFVDYMLSFDGYIVGFNNIHFDNPVCAYNCWYGEQEIKILNEKTIDLYQIVYNLTWKRMWLNKISSNLLWLSKTLEKWWMEGDKLLKAYNETGDKKAYSKVKEYCKNDVKMTLAVMLYFMREGNLYIDGDSYEFSPSDMVELWKMKKGEQAPSTKAQWFFD